MNSYTILDAIGMIDDQYVLSAQNRFGYEVVQATSAESAFSGKHIRSRAFIGIAVAMLLVISSFATAMAVNEDFREKVFEFSIFQRQKMCRTAMLLTRMELSWKAKFLLNILISEKS